MIWMLILLFLGLSLGFILFTLLYMSSKQEESEEQHCLAVTDEPYTTENFPLSWGTGAKRIQLTTLGILKTKKRILFVDNEEYLVDLVDRMLRHLGYEVMALDSSLNALEQIKSKKNKFDLIIVDQVMPELSGTEFAKEANRIQPKLPIILFTGFSDMISKDKLKDFGIQEVVAKPIRLSDLSQVINKMLSLSATDELKMS